MQKVIIFLGVIFFACSVQAQVSDGTNSPADTAHHAGMHRHWGRNDDRRDGARRNDDKRDGRDGEYGRGFRSFGERGGRPHIHFTPEQRQQMQAINSDYHKKSADLFKNDNMSLRDYKAGLLALQKDRKSKIQALATPQQKEQMEKWKKSRAENAQVMVAARMERLKIRLSLTDQQVATLKSRESDLRNQMKSLHENDALLPQQKMEQFKEMAAKRKELVKSVLTPDQLSKYNEMEMSRRLHHGEQDGR
jgi:Spy/CpxP family protein refolding chaperone